MSALAANVHVPLLLVNAAVWSAYGYLIEVVRHTGSRDVRSLTFALALVGGVLMFVLGART